MAYDEAIAGAMRAALAGRAGIGERKMFGGIAFLEHGNMVCGAYRDRGVYRVGKANAAAALALPHVRPMAMSGRAMPGMVEVEPGGFGDPEVQERLMALALGFVAGLPPK